MEDFMKGQTDHEKKLFEDVKSDLRHERDHALRYWEKIKKRYLYRGRQYSAQEVIDWFMSAPFMDVKTISEELGIDWKTIGNDIRRIADPLKGFEEEQKFFSETKEPFVEDTGIYAKPRVIEDTARCYLTSG